METEAQRQHTGVTDNVGFNNANIIHIRINTDDILQRIKDFLSGEEVVAKEEGGSIVYVKEQVYTPLCNEDGIRHITNQITSIVNPSVVQGNWTRDKYELEVELLHKELAFILINNYDRWGMNFEDLDSIIVFMMNLIRPYLSRLIDNGERESYGNSMKVLESNKIERGSSGFSLFGRKG